MNIVKNIFLLLSSALIITACATSSDKIATTYTSSMQYSTYSCDQLSQELVRLNNKKTSLASQIDGESSDDTTLTAVGVVLFWPSLFFLGGNEAQEAEYAKLKGEYEAVEQSAIIKNC
tara:strand:+ start:355 stop:708 length:354 start_codon:yes stop_codon:yes gene_type:complete